MSAQMETISPPQAAAASAPALLSRQSAPPSGAPRDAAETLDGALQQPQMRGQDQVAMATEDPSVPSLLSPGIKVEFHGSASTFPLSQPTGDVRDEGLDNARPSMAAHPR
jgi:hypothetical protein